VTEPLDVEYVELRARGAQETARAISRTLHEIEHDASSTSHEIEADFTAALGEIFAEFGGLSEGVKKEFNKIEHEAADAARAIAVDLSAAAQVAQVEIDDMADHAVRDFKRVGRQAEETAAETTAAFSFGALLDTLKNALGGIGGAVGGVAGGIGNVLSLGTGSPLVGFIVALTPAIIALAGALGDLLGLLLLLPGAFGVLLSTILPLVLAFHGMGQAISAIASGDINKIHEAFKNLAPAARSVAREISGIMGPLKDLQKAVQESFFAPLKGVITLIGRELLPVVKPGFVAIASALGNLTAEFGRLLASQAVIHALGELFAATATIFTALTPHIINLLGVLFGVMERGLPFIVRIADAFGVALDKFAEFLGESMKSGDFDKFLNDAFATVKDLFDLAGALWDLLKALFGNAGDEGRSFLQTLTQITKELADFFASDQGQQFIHNILDLLPVLAFLLEGTAGSVMFLADTINVLVDAGKEVAHWIAEAARAVGDFFTSAGGAVSSAGSSIGDFFVGLWHSIVDFWNGAVGIFNSIVDFVASVPGKILAALEALPHILTSLATRAFDAFFTAVGVGIGIIIKEFFDLPQQVLGILTFLWHGAVNIFTNLLDRSVQIAAKLVTDVGNFFSALPGRVASFFSEAWSRGRAIFSAGVDAVVAFARSLPGRVGSAVSGVGHTIASVFSGVVSTMYDIGHDIIFGIIHGIEGAVQAAINVVKRAVGDIIHGAKHVLGIESPSKVFAEMGKMSVAGFGVGFENEGPAATTTVQDTLGGAARGLVPALAGGGGASVTFGPGAVQVVFQGVVPTESEARRTGTAVMAGIADTLSHQLARTNVRML